MRAPKTLGARIDLLARKRAARLKLEKQVEAEKRTEAQLAELILEDLAKSKIDSAKGKTASFTRKVETVAKVVDWEKFYRFIKKNDAFDLLQRRVTQTAYRDRIEDGPVDGTEAEHVIKYTLRTTR